MLGKISSPVLIVVLPFLFSSIVQLIPRGTGRRACGWAALSGSLLALSISFVALLRVLDGGRAVFMLGSPEVAKGIPLVADGLGISMAVLGGTLGVLCLCYSIGEGGYGPGYYSLFLILLGGMSGVFLSGDLFNIYVFMEVLSVSSYILVAYRGRGRSFLASINYLLISNVGLALYLLGTGMIYNIAGTLNIELLSERLSAPGADHGTIATSAALIITGIGIKAALVPLHTWLPDAHSQAPTPVSALLSGAMVKVGIYLLIRISGIFTAVGFGWLFMWMGAISALVGVVFALCQKDIKMILANHTISQIGYIMAAFGSGSPLSLIGAIYHTTGHAFFKGLLFLSAGAAIRLSGRRDVTELRGLWRSAPFVGAMCLIGSLSIAGIPLFAGFVSKSIIAESLSEERIIYLLISISAVGTVASFIKVMRIFFGESQDATPVGINLAMKLPMAVLSALCLLMGLFPGWNISTLGRLLGISIDGLSLRPFGKLFSSALTALLGLMLYLLILRLRGLTDRIGSFRPTVNLGLLLVAGYLASILILYALF